MPFGQRFSYSRRCETGSIASIIAPACRATGTAAQTATDPARFRERLPENEVIYLVMPDRFANGDPMNDRGGQSGDRVATDCDSTDIKDRRTPRAGRMTA